MIKIALLGLGTVGQGVYEIINSKKGKMIENDALCIAKVLVRDIAKPRAFLSDPSILTTNIDDILNDPSISIVVSVMGPVEPEYTYIKKALSLGKHVVTANKAIVAPHLEELLNLAKENRVHFLFEAAVGGGVPIIDSIIETIKINKVDKVLGILNGTTNFILSKMAKTHADFPVVLREAQQLGFAEADPTSDIEGYDVARKITILASLAFGQMVDESKISLTGISNISSDDIAMADEHGYILKYIAYAQLKEKNYHIFVAPMLIKKQSVVSHVDMEYNIVSINGNFIGELSFLGKGAGKDATANSVVADVLRVLSGDVDYAHLSFDKKISQQEFSDEAYVYCLRISIQNSAMLAKVIDTVAKYVSRNNMILTRGKLYYKTEKLSDRTVSSLREELLAITPDIFIARAVKDIL